MPELIKLYIRNVAIGFGLAAVFVAMLLWFDTQGLWQLVSNSSSGPLAVFLLWFMHGIVFAGVQFSLVIMRMADDDEPKGGKRAPVATTVPAPVAIPAPKQR